MRPESGGAGQKDRLKIFRQAPRFYGLQVEEVQSVQEFFHGAADEMGETCGAGVRFRVKRFLGI